MAPRCPPDSSDIIQMVVHRIAMPNHHPQRCRSRRLTEPLRQLALRYRRPPPTLGHERGPAERRARRCGARSGFYSASGTISPIYGHRPVGQSHRINNRTPVARVAYIMHRTTQGARRKNRKPLKRTHHPTQHGTSGLEGLLRLPSAKKRPWGVFWGLNTKKGQAFGENNYKSSRSCTPQSLLFCFE